MNNHSRTALGHLSWLRLLIYLFGVIAYPSSCSGLPSLKTDEVSSLMSTTATHAVAWAHHFSSFILVSTSTYFTISFCDWSIHSTYEFNFYIY